MQWESNKKNNMGLEGKSIVCCCDVSGSMEVDNCTPLNNAIGLSIRISELVDENSGLKIEFSRLIVDQRGYNLMMIWF